MAKVGSAGLVVIPTFPDTKKQVNSIRRTSALHVYNPLRSIDNKNTRDSRISNTNDYQEGDFNN